MYEETPFCHFSYLSTFTFLGRLSNLLYLSFEYLSFSNKLKTTILFLSSFTFLFPLLSGIAKISRHWCTKMAGIFVQYKTSVLLVCIYCEGIMKVSYLLLIFLYFCIKKTLKIHHFEFSFCMSLSILTTIRLSLHLL